MKKILLFSLVLLSSFLTIAQTPILQFNFDGTFSSTKNDVSFTGDAIFVSDRNGGADNAIRVFNCVIEVTARNLPVGNSSRTVSIWVKYNDLTAANYIWGYGSPSNAQYFGLLQQSTETANSDLNLAGYGPNNDLITTTTVAQSIWYNYIVTYDGITSKIYRDGLLLKSAESPRKLTTGTVFSIGKIGTNISINADIDDLQVYNTALSGEQVMALYKTNLVKGNNLAVAYPALKKIEKKGNVKINRAIKPVSVNNVANRKPVNTGSTHVIKQELLLSNPVETAVAKSLEIYSVKGLKVFSGTNNKIDITNIEEGSYLLNIKKSEAGTNAKTITLK